MISLISTTVRRDESLVAEGRRMTLRLRSGSLPGTYHCCFWYSQCVITANWPNRQVQLVDEEVYNSYNSTVHICMCNVFGSNRLISARAGNYTSFRARGVCIRVDLRCIRRTTGIWPIIRQSAEIARNRHIQLYTT